jgi:hypothetical protein
MSEKEDSGTQLSRDALISELQKLAGDINEEGLLFLIKQANVLRYNQSAEEYNRKVRTLKSGTKPVGTGVAEKNYSVEVVEKNEGKHFFIVIKGFHIFFTREEMRKIVKICHSAESETDAVLRLYNWFLKNRKDLLVDADIGSPKSPYLGSLYQYLIHTYTVRE